KALENAWSKMPLLFSSVEGNVDMSAIVEIRIAMEKAGIYHIDNIFIGQSFANELPEGEVSEDSDESDQSEDLDDPDHGQNEDEEQNDEDGNSDHDLDDSSEEQNSDINNENQNENGSDEDVIIDQKEEKDS